MPSKDYSTLEIPEVMHEVVRTAIDDTNATLKSASKIEDLFRLWNAANNLYRAATYLSNRTLVVDASAKHEEEKNV